MKKFWYILGIVLLSYSAPISANPLINKVNRIIAHIPPSHSALKTELQDLITKKNHSKIFPTSEIVKHAFSGLHATAYESAESRLKLHGIFTQHDPSTWQSQVARAWWISGQASQPRCSNCTRAIGGLQGPCSKGVLPRTLRTILRQIRDEMLRSEVENILKEYQTDVKELSAAATATNESDVIGLVQEGTDFVEDLETQIEEDPLLASDEGRSSLP